MKQIIIIVVALFSFSNVVIAQSKAGKQDTAKHVTLSSCPKHIGSLVYDPAKCPNCGMSLNLSKKEIMKMQVTKSYSCPANASLAVNEARNLSPKEKIKWEIVKASQGVNNECKMDMVMSR